MMHALQIVHIVSDVVAREDDRVRSGRGEVLVPVPEPLDDPRRLDVDEHGVVVRGAGRRKDASDGHL